MFLQVYLGAVEKRIIDEAPEPATQRLIVLNKPLLELADRNFLLKLVKAGLLFFVLAFLFCMAGVFSSTQFLLSIVGAALCVIIVATFLMWKLSLRAEIKGRRVEIYDLVKDGTYTNDEIRLLDGFNSVAVGYVHDIVTEVEKRDEDMSDASDVHTKINKQDKSQRESLRILLDKLEEIRSIEIAIVITWISFVLLFFVTLYAACICLGIQPDFSGELEPLWIKLVMTGAAALAALVLFGVLCGYKRSLSKGGHKLRARLEKSPKTRARLQLLLSFDPSLRTLLVRKGWDHFLEPIPV